MNRPGEQVKCSVTDPGVGRAGPVVPSGRDIAFTSPSVSVRILATVPVRGSEMCDPVPVAEDIGAFGAVGPAPVGTVNRAGSVAEGGARHVVAGRRWGSGAVGTGTGRRRASMVRPPARGRPIGSPDADGLPGGRHHEQDRGSQAQHPGGDGEPPQPGLGQVVAQWQEHQFHEDGGAAQGGVAPMQ